MAEIQEANPEREMETEWTIIFPKLNVSINLKALFSLNQTDSWNQILQF